MTVYAIKNDSGETFAVVIKFASGRCLVQYERTWFESIDQMGQFMNDTTLRLQPVEERSLVCLEKPKTAESVNLLALV